MDREENKNVAKMGGHAAKVAREDLEKNLGKTVISYKNALGYQYEKTKKLDEGKKFNVQNNNKHAANSNKNLGHIFNYKNLFRQQSYNFNFNLKFGKSKSSLNKKNLNYQFNKLRLNFQFLS